MSTSRSSTIAILRGQIGTIFRLSPDIVEQGISQRDTIPEIQALMGITHDPATNSILYARFPPLFYADETSKAKDLFHGDFLFAVST